MDELAQKLEFAMRLVKQPNDPMGVACLLYPADFPRAAFVASQWPSCPEVLEEITRLKNEVGLDGLLPTKEEAAQAAWLLSQDGTADIKERAAALKLFCDIQGFIAPKPTAIINNNSLNDNRRVMMVTNHNNDVEWEEKLIENQRALTNATAVN